MTTSEPTTGEIVSALRDCSKTSCSECICQSIGTERPLCGAKPIADRLESQEQTIAALTARAESAERERDAVKAYMKRFGCLTCTGQGTLALNDPCGSCRDKSKWEMRGQPQDGEGKK